MFKMDVSKPENSLAFITDKEGFTISAVLVTHDCVLALCIPLLQFFCRDVSSIKLFVGLGTDPCNEDIDNKYLHPVDKRAYEFHKDYLQRERIKKVTIIMVRSFT